VEEKDSGAAIRKAGARIFHFHACENDRGTPGTGQVRWDAIKGALFEAGYAGPVVIEAFNRDIKEIARAVALWRPLAASPDELASEGLRFLRELLG